MAETTPQPAQSRRWYGLAYLVIFIAGVGFFLLSFLALGVLPGERLSASIASHSQADMPDYTPAELRGRRIYTSLGCALCHTQQVRYLPADVRRWGAPTDAWETRYDFPQLWGTRRIGPDLARETQVRSNDWQLTHLYQPQWVVPDSVMPSFTWLFNGSPNRPSPAAQDLLAYLKTLGRARQLGEGKRTGPRVDTGMDPAMWIEVAGLCATPFINPNQARVVAGDPHLKLPVQHPDQLVSQGRELFVQNCAGCHGATGDGNGPAAVGLLPRPADLRLSRFSTEALANSLWNGVAGSAMPAWRDLPARNIASLIRYVQTLSLAAPDAQPVSAAVLARGAVVYAGNCVACHGVEGNGEGIAAPQRLPRPANFTAIQPAAIRVTQVLLHGVPGTSMPAWPSLDAADQRAVSAFVRSFYPKEATP